MKERRFIVKDRHINVSHTQDMKFIHDGHDSKVNE